MGTFTGTTPGAFNDVPDPFAMTLYCSECEELLGEPEVEKGMGDEHGDLLAWHCRCGTSGDINRADYGVPGWQDLVLWCPPNAEGGE